MPFSERMRRAGPGVGAWLRQRPPSRAGLRSADGPRRVAFFSRRRCAAGPKATRRPGARDCPGRTGHTALGLRHAPRAVMCWAISFFRDSGGGEVAPFPRSHAYLGIVCLCFARLCRVPTGFLRRSRVLVAGPHPPDRVVPGWLLVCWQASTDLADGFYSRGPFSSFAKCAPSIASAFLTALPAAVLAASRPATPVLPGCRPRARSHGPYSPPSTLSRSPTWAIVPFRRVGNSPPYPPVTHSCARRIPTPLFLEVPQCNSGSAGASLNAVCMYWQSLHRGTTTAGYSGYENRPLQRALSRTFAVCRVPPGKGRLPGKSRGDDGGPPAQRPLRRTMPGCT